ncbi:NAD-dependent epimerase/dehydratase family protein [Aliifodinibius sp. S!AR15-10]|uniref:NAD-dependent epimerase/dehydratase family protein n=1 Tax=Aliifodinibius sp. S!AR15-10 TaxID=2950437 RepID=UPI00285997CF|nr:NAD-dependent epimerase/dehydratase family protein [Aliifodinibius sp. S!AR15-10]MDR8393775.1 NAD-dependent epimerase/dehydratase family protein [Aliifodinibius sp. S!AR15-10]
MQTILGAGGAVGRALAKELTEFTGEIRLVSRSPEKVNPSDQLVSADLLNLSDTRKSVAGASVAYLTAGLRYDLDVWQESWPKIMQNVITACNEHDCKLVFFDNIYMYDENYLDGMDEETPVNPPSKKGEIRARIARMLMEAVDAGELTALIARSADFYGPNIKDTSMLTETVINPLREGKKANWLGSADVKHSFTYVPDAAKATALLGNTEDAYNQIWHLPTAGDPPTGKEWIEAIANELGVKPKYRTAPKFVVRLIGLFDSVMSEIVEMYYQYDRDYVFNSTKFEKRFDFAPTPYVEGIRETVKAERN